MYKGKKFWRRRGNYAQDAITTHWYNHHYPSGSVLYKPAPKDGHGDGTHGLKLSLPPIKLPTGGYMTTINRFRKTQWRRLKTQSKKVMPSN